MLGLRYFGRYRKNKSPEPTDSEQFPSSDRSSSPPPEEISIPSTSQSWRNTFPGPENAKTTPVAGLFATVARQSLVTGVPGSQGAQSPPLGHLGPPEHISSSPERTSSPAKTSGPPRVDTPKLSQTDRSALQQSSGSITDRYSPEPLTKPSKVEQDPVITTFPRTTGPNHSSTMLSPKLQSSNQSHGSNGLNGSLSPLQSPKAIYNSKGRLPSFASSRATSGYFSTAKSSTHKRTSWPSGHKIGFVQEAAAALRKKSMSDVGAVVSQSISDVSYVKFLEWIRSERLTTLPHKGSRWDKVLIRALYFAEQVHIFEQAIQGFALDSSSAAAIGYGHAQLLLELGHENSEALDKAFSLFHKISLSFSSVLHRSELLAVTSDIREQLCLLFTDLLSLVVDVSVRFYKMANGMASKSVSLDMFEVFRETIETFRTRRDSVVELIWSYQIENEELDEDEAVDVKDLGRWLAPHDRVLESLNRDHSIYVDQQVEFTCLWFQKDLTKFIQSDKNFLLVTGPAGAGKTTLAGSVVERFQRPVNGKHYQTVFCSLSPDIPITATSLAVAKSLLSQLLNQRIGNMGTYHAVLRAYNQCRGSHDLKAYEESLWNALADALKRPFGGSNDLVIVVDGLDEIAESQSESIKASGTVVPTSLLQRLIGITKEGRGARLVTFSSSIKAPPNAAVVHREITREDVRDDLHAVALRALIHNHNFRGQKGFDQEAMLDHLIQTANGSFLWTMLACQILNTQPTPHAVTKTLESLESSKPSTHELILQLFTSLKITDNTKILLSWMLAAERPLTIDEIHTLFTVDVQNGTIVDKGVNVQETIHCVLPILTLHERIVRFRHPIIHAVLHASAKNKKISIPLQESETDLLLRVLTYAKCTLRDKGEPTIDNLDPSVADALFRKHHLLEYTVRYWVLHLQQSSLAPKSEEYKPTADLKRAFPETAILPALEQICWNTQLPTSQVIELHKLVGTVRRALFTETHPSVLQTYLAIAMGYLRISMTTEAAKYFYWAIKISRTVLSYVHPLTLECATYFLEITESFKFSKRTEIVTYREDVLTMLITAYERQYGSTSDLVVQTRKLLAELYISIHEEDKAIEIYRQLQEITIQQYGDNSHQAQDLQGTLSVVLGKSKGDAQIDGYKESYFHNEDEEVSMEVFDLSSIATYLHRAEEYFAKKEYALAERTYVELWIEVSSRCRTTQSIEWHQKNVEVAIAYAQYLKTQQRTSESSAILTTIWQQYEHHQVSHSDKMVRSLTKVAKELKSIGNQTTALAIFKFASRYYINMGMEESHDLTAVNKELSETSTEILKHSLASSSTVTETTSSVSGSLFQDAFFSVIQSSNTVDSSTMTLAKKLTAQYIEQRNYSAAIKVIQATLQRTWSSFLLDSIHDVEMTSTFTKQSIELVEKLAICYLETKQMEKVEDTYSRFFRAVMAKQNVEHSIFEKAKTLLVSYYDRHGHADHAISVLQEALVFYRNKYGPTNQLTIQTLYTLARRCRAHPRNHPYWIEYYLQIISNLNKDSQVCHKDALDAIVVVTNTYWEDRRYAEAVAIYRVLWNTFITQTKQHQLFSDTKFVQTLYEHYYQCLEETKASYDSLFQVTNEYRETCVATFGAQSAITIEASLSLARVAQQSEEHMSTAVSLYEDVSKTSKTTAIRTSVTEIQQALSSLYVRQMHSSTSTNMTAETVSRAVNIAKERFIDSTRKYGYSHELSLTNLKELCVLYCKQQKADVAVKELASAISQIITKETSSEKLIESASYIASTFQSIGQTMTAHSLVQELHRQICAKEIGHATKWSFDLTKSGRTALAFLAALQYHLRTDLAITFAEIMADLTMEYIYFSQFRQTLLNNESLTNILLAAVPLRWFLLRKSQQEMIAVVEEQIVGIFVKRDTQDLNTLSKESPRIFIVSILDHLGNGRKADFNRSVILASNSTVNILTKTKRFTEAYDIANLAFLFACKHNAYTGAGSISMGFKLASLLVGRDGEKCTDAMLRKKMLELSNRIVQKIISICKDMDINFAKIQLYELSHLSSLLGEQHDYDTLEWLLTTLWTTRDAQRTWPPIVLLNLGRRLICARYLAGQPVKAIRLCEDIAYNMRRAYGPHAPVTIETYELLAQLYTSTAQWYQSKADKDKTGSLAQEYYKKAFLAHEDILKLVALDSAHGDSYGNNEDGSDDELDSAAQLLANEGVSVRSLDGYNDNEDALEDDTIDRSAVALKHLRLMKLAFQRLGGWPKPYEEYQRLNSLLFRTFGDDKAWKGVRGVETWDVKPYGTGKAEAQEGGFVGVRDWALGSEKMISQAPNYSRHEHGMSGLGWRPDMPGASIAVGA